MNKAIIKFSLLRHLNWLIKNWRYIFCSRNITLGACASAYTSALESPCAVGDGSSLVNSTMGRYSYIGSGCSVHNSHIGAYCSIASRVVIGPGLHPAHFVSSSPVFYSTFNRFGSVWVNKNRFTEGKSCYIGNDVWIGINAVILDGVTIHDGAIIGANAVVTKDVEPYAIMGGVPAKLIRYRFDQDTIDELLKLEWWNINPDVLKRYTYYAGNVKVFIEKLSKKERNDIE